MNWPTLHQFKMYTARAPIWVILDGVLFTAPVGVPIKARTRVLLDGRMPLRGSYWVEFDAESSDPHAADYEKSGMILTIPGYGEMLRVIVEGQ